MPPAAVKGWKQVLALLQAQQALLPQTDSAAARNQADKLSKAFKRQLGSLEATESVTRSAWKAIIREQVGVWVSSDKPSV